MKEKNANLMISVIVPTYQRHEMLPRAIESILSQSWENIELIVVDDNVNDSEHQKKTYETVEPYLGDSRVRYLKTSGKTGGGAARNFAIRQAKGEYLAFLDDDDKYLPGKLEKQLEFMLENNLDLCYQDVKWFNSNEKLVEFRKMDIADDFSTEGLLRAHILHSIAPTAIYMIRRDKLLETEGFGEVSCGQDFILMLRCIESGMKIGYMPGAYVAQYLHEGERLSTGTNKINGENRLYELKHKYFSYLTAKDKRYVRFRHYAVLSFASLRSHRPVRAICYAVVTVFSSPMDCLREAKRYFGNRHGE